MTKLGDEPILSIEAKKLKIEGNITLEDEHIGKTTVNGWFFNSYYEVDVWDSRITIEPILLAGMVYTFWSTSNRR